MTGSGSKADSSDRPLALPIRAAVARDRPTFAAIFQKGMRLRRIASTASSCSLPVFFLSRLGLLVRSCSPAVPSALCRRTHLQTVAVETPRAVAMAPDVSPAALRLTICSRPRGVSLAFLCTFMGRSGRLWFVAKFTYLLSFP